MKQIKQILLISGMITGILLYMLIDSFLIAPSKYTVRYQTLTAASIPADLENMKILYFSDLYYGKNMNEKRLEKLIETIRHVAPDVVVFGGDLYDPTAVASVKTDSALTNALSSIQAPFGKFAVLGDNDCVTAEQQDHIQSILKSSNFETLSNTAVSIHKHTSVSISLVGLDNAVNRTPDTAAAYMNIPIEQFVITVCHTPDTVSLAPLDLTDYFIAGHSLGGQAYYLFGAYHTPEMAVNYLRGKHSIQDTFLLDITNGVGTADIDMRFLTPAEVVCYTLHSTSEIPAESIEQGSFHESDSAASQISDAPSEETLIGAPETENIMPDEPNQ